MAGGTLRHDNKHSKPRPILADRDSDTDLCLQQTIGAALDGTVQKENNGPFSVRRPVVWDEDLIFVVEIIDGESSVEESRFTSMGACGYRQSHGRTRKKLKRNRAGNIGTSEPTNLPQRGDGGCDRCLDWKRQVVRNLGS